MTFSPARDLLHLVRIEVRRNQGWLVAGLMVVMSEPLRDWNILANGTTWYYIWAILGDSAIALAIAGGFAGWVASRPRRHRTDELLSSGHRFTENQLVPDLIAVLVWMLVAWTVTLVIPAAAIALRQGMPDGRVPWEALLILAMSATAAVCGGYAVGLAAPERFAGPTAAIAVFLFWITMSYITTRIPGMDAIVPYRSERFIYPGPMLPANVDLVRGNLLVNLLLTVTLVGAILLVRKQSVLRRVGLVGSLLLTVVAGTQVVAMAQRSLEPGFVRYTEATPVCLIGDHVQICVHPLNEPFAVESLPMLDGVVGRVAGLPDIPKTLVGDTIDPTPYAPPFLDFFPLPSGEQAFFLALRVVSTPEVSTPPSASQVVVACWLAQQEPGICPVVGWSTAEGGSIGGESGPADQEVIILELEAEMNEAITGFGALDDATRRAWLEANWTALRAGQIVLDQLP